jgi:hypothetical protein
MCAFLPYRAPSLSLLFRDGCELLSVRGALLVDGLLGESRGAIFWRCRFGAARSISTSQLPSRPDRLWRLRQFFAELGLRPYPDLTGAIRNQAHRPENALPARGPLRLVAHEAERQRGGEGFEGSLGDCDADYWDRRAVASAKLNFYAAGRCAGKHADSRRKVFHTRFRRDGWGAAPALLCPWE